MVTPTIHSAMHKGAQSEFPLLVGGEQVVPYPVLILITPYEALIEWAGDRLAHTPLTA